MSSSNNNFIFASGYANPSSVSHDEYDRAVIESKKALLSADSAQPDGSDRLRVSVEERRSGCWDIVKNFMNSDKSIVLIAKLSIILTGMIGSLYLFIQSSEFTSANPESNDASTSSSTTDSPIIDPTSSAFIDDDTSGVGSPQFSLTPIRNDNPLQKVVMKYLILCLFLFAKAVEEAKRERHFLNSESPIPPIHESALLGLLDFIQSACFVSSLSYTSVVRAQLFTSTQIAILLLLKKRDNVEIYMKEFLALFMNIAAQILIACLRAPSEALTLTSASWIKGDLLCLAGGIIGSIAYFRENYKGRLYYKSQYSSNLFSLIFAIVAAYSFDSSGAFMFSSMDARGFAAILAIGSFESIASIKKIKTFVFMKYFKNIFEPLVAFKFEWVILRAQRLDSWTVLIVFVVLAIPANIIMMKSHAEDIKSNKRYRDSTFVDVLNFEEYIEMQTIQSHSNLPSSQQHQLQQQQQPQHAQTSLLQLPTSQSQTQLH